MGAIEFLFQPEQTTKGFSPGTKDFRTAATTEKNHGRLEHRRLTVSAELKGYLAWPGAEQVFKLEMVFLGNPEYGVALQPIDFAAFARACGGQGMTVTDPAACGDAVEQALNTPGPVLLEAGVDPYEPPQPAKITKDQAAKFAQSLARGEPERMKIATTIAEDVVREMV